MNLIERVINKTTVSVDHNSTTSLWRPFVQPYMLAKGKPIGFWLNIDKPVFLPDNYKVIQIFNPKVRTYFQIIDC